MRNRDAYTLVLSGGGTRYALYCGMWDALEEAGIRPRFLLASCGGALAATLINAFPSSSERKSYLCSEEFYEFIRSLQVTHEAKLHKLPAYCLKILLLQKKSLCIDQVIKRYLVNMPRDLSIDLPELALRSTATIPTIIVAGRVNGMRYKRVLFTDSETASQLQFPPDYESYQGSSIESGYEIITGVNLLTASRISLSDPFYVPPVQLNGENFLGGAIDLFPLELASLLGHQIIAERKQGYSGIEEAVIRNVFGFSARERLSESERIKALRIDTSDNKQVLASHYLRKTIKWSHFQLALTNHLSHHDYCQQIEKQWQYGYERTLLALCQNKY